MSVSQKCQYALRAVFELASRHGDAPTSIREIAQAQAIPPKFLELILVQLRKAGFVESRRGAHGGYFLAVGPAALTVGEIIRFIDGPIAPVITDMPICLILPVVQPINPNGHPIHRYRNYLQT